VGGAALGVLVGGLLHDHPVACPPQFRINISLCRCHLR
jgi:hypothetical protein